MKIAVLMILVWPSWAQIRIVGPPIYMGSSLDPVKSPIIHKKPTAPVHEFKPEKQYPSLTFEPIASGSGAIPIIDIESLDFSPPLPHPDKKPTVQQFNKFKSGPSTYEPLRNEDPLVIPPCNISKPGLSTPFALIDNMNVPCNEPFILDPIRIGGPLPTGVRIKKGTQQTIAIRIPTPTNSLIGVIASRNNIIQSNISSPIFGRRNPAFHRGVKVKNWKRHTDCKLATKTQIDLITSLHTILTNEARVKGAFAFSSKSNSQLKSAQNLPPMQIHHIQSYGLSPAPLSGANEEDFRLADEIFGFRGARFEFDEPWRTARVIEKSIGKNLGNHTDRNYLSTFRELFRFTNNAHAELHNLGEFQAKTVYKQHQSNILSRRVTYGEAVMLEPKNIRCGASFTSTLSRGNY